MQRYRGGPISPMELRDVVHGHPRCLVNGADLRVGEQNDVSEFLHLFFDMHADDCGQCETVRCMDRRRHGMFVFQGWNAVQTTTMRCLECGRRGRKDEPISVLALPLERADVPDVRRGQALSLSNLLLADQEEEQVLYKCYESEGSGCTSVRGNVRTVLRTVLPQLCEAPMLLEARD
jgi:hypothetical protein